jgi:membrane peptidoglycan carboxypeptidase
MKKKNKIRFKILKLLFLFILSIVITLTIILFLVMNNIIDTRQTMVKENQVIKDIITYEKNNDEVLVISKFNKNNTDYIPYDKLPKYLIDAVISIEDKRFYEHDGIDYLRTLGAIYSYLINDGQSDFGGSTITQQLVKTVTLDNDKTWTRKIREWYRSFDIERNLNKEDIITTYLNSIYFGNENYGIKKVANDYLNKNVEDLNLAECAMIAASIQSPENTNPFKNNESKQRLLERKNLVLLEMLNLNKVNKEEYNKALEYKIKFRK